jgi:hypothetical protein
MARIVQVAAAGLCVAAGGVALVATPALAHVVPDRRAAPPVAMPTAPRARARTRRPAPAPGTDGGSGTESTEDAGT